MTYLPEVIREAIAAKALASTLAQAAGLRYASIDTENWTKPPQLIVLPGEMDDLDPNMGLTERYALSYSAELLVPSPAGGLRSSPVAVAICYALQQEWRTHFKLGLDTSGVVSSFLTSWRFGLSEYAFTGLTGYTLTFLVRVYEVITPRTE